jgi:ribosomal protein L37AE/L43A
VKWGYSGYTKSETRGMLRDVKGEEQLKSHQNSEYICHSCGKEISEKTFLWQGGLCDKCMEENL